jgi:hypothetical protein
VEIARVEVLGQYVKWLRILSEEGEIKNGLGPWEIELGEICIQARLW